MVVDDFYDLYLCHVFLVNPSIFQSRYGFVLHLEYQAKRMNKVDGELLVAIRGKLVAATRWFCRNICKA